MGQGLPLLNLRLMPHQPRKFANGEFYHIVLRRIANEKLFIDTDDYYRGIFSIYEFNNDQPVEIKKRRREIAFIKKRRADLRHDSGGGLPSATLPSATNKRDCFVDVLLFALMPNHIHLLVKQLKDNGISKYMQKIGSGFSNYFRKKYDLKLTGHFFQDRFKSVHIKTDEQLIVLFSYIHTNPLSLIEPGWKKNGIKNPKKAIHFLENKYRWSSYFDYLGKKNFPSVTKRDFLLEVIGGQNRSRKIVNSWIQEKAKMRKEIEKFSDILLE